MLAMNFRWRFDGKMMEEITVSLLMFLSLQNLVDGLSQSHENTFLENVGRVDGRFQATILVSFYHSKFCKNEAI